MNKAEYIGKCPKCKSNHVKHIKTPKYDFYACEDRSCGFTLNSVVFGKKLTEKQVEKLLSNGTTGNIKGLKGSKKSFDAEIIMNDEYKLVPKFKK
nr:topoisomerase C-terminal repeat-containing protein [Macrococcus sp. PK]